MGMGLMSVTWLCINEVKRVMLYTYLPRVRIQNEVWHYTFGLAAARVVVSCFTGSVGPQEGETPPPWLPATTAMARDTAACMFVNTQR